MVSFVEDVQIELLQHKTSFLEKVLLTLQSLFNNNNPLDFVSMERHASAARLGVLEALKKAVTKIATVPQRPILSSSSKIIRIVIEVRWKRDPRRRPVHTQTVDVDEDLPLSTLRVLLRSAKGKDIRLSDNARITTSKEGGIPFNQSRTFKDVGITMGRTIYIKSYAGCYSNYCS